KMLEILITSVLRSKIRDMIQTIKEISYPTVTNKKATKRFGMIFNMLLNTVVIGSEIERIFNASSAVTIIGIKINTYSTLAKTVERLIDSSSVQAPDCGLPRSNHLSTFTL